MSNVGDAAGSVEKYWNCLEKEFVNRYTNKVGDTNAHCHASKRFGILESRVPEYLHAMILLLEDALPEFGSG